MQTAARASRVASLRRRCGFTLVEVVAAIVVLAIIGSIASQTIVAGVGGYVQASTQAQLHAELSIALERIERELRQIPLKAGSSIAPNISAVTTTSVAWGTSTLNLSGNQLLLNDSGAGSAILLDQVSSFSVQTFDEANGALSANLSGNACDAIRRISISISLQRAGITETLRTKLFLRNTLEGASP